MVKNIFTGILLRTAVVTVAGALLCLIYVKKSNSQTESHLNNSEAFANEDKTVGLRVKKQESWEGYTLFAPKHRTMTYLLDNDGNAVHKWTASDFEPGQTVYLLPNGNLLRCCFIHNKGMTRGGEGGRIEEYDWDDNLVWKLDFATDKYMLHHDIAVLPNGNILALAVELKTYKECVAAGFTDRMLLDNELCPDYVVEIQPTRPYGGKIVWEWHVWDHLIQDEYPEKANYGTVTAHPERVDVNCNGREAPAFWNHMNSIAYNAKLDQIILSVRGSSELWIIDHSTTTAEARSDSGGRYGKGGDLLYRWGNPAAYGRGTESGRQLYDQHDAHWIPDDCPGAGNILIFNNGCGRGYSSIEEIAPPITDQGTYGLESDTAYGPAASAWSYSALNKKDFYSPEISGAQRIPNGNTLICAGVSGVLFEVTADGKMVWEYINPEVRGGTLAQGESPGTDHRGHYLNAVFKIHRYAADYQGFGDRDLSSLGVIELPISMKGKTGLDKVSTPPENHQPNQTQREKRLRSLGYL